LCIFPSPSPLHRSIISEQTPAFIVIVLDIIPLSTHHNFPNDFSAKHLKCNFYPHSQTFNTLVKEGILKRRIIFHKNENENENCIMKDEKTEKIANIVWGGKLTLIEKVKGKSL
jgi:hypothetical protein